MHNSLKQKKPRHRARKRFGQNFLHSDHIVQQIIDAVNVHPDDTIVEIGPGLGALTDPLLDSAQSLIAIELDRDLLPRLLQRFGDHSSFTLHNADALTFNFSELYDGNNQLRLVGNLPYNISTPLIFHLLTFKSCINDMYFMLQKEVVDRLSARHNTRQYGRLSVMAQYHCEVEALFEVPPHCFQPAPKVDSAVVRLRPFTRSPHPNVSTKQLDRVVTQAFSQRRKTVKNTLGKLIPTANLEELGIDPQARAENLSVSSFVAIANCLANGESTDNRRQPE